MRATVTLSSCWAGIFDIVGVAAALAVVAARAPEIIVDLAGLEFIDSSGVAALARGRKLARHAGGDLLLAAPQHQVLRVLTLTRLIDVFPGLRQRGRGGQDRRAHPAGGRASGRESRSRRVTGFQPHPLWLASAAGRLGTAAALSGRAPARMLVIEVCPAWSVTSACGACGCALA